MTGRLPMLVLLNNKGKPAIPNNKIDWFDEEDVVFEIDRAQKNNKETKQRINL